jgi:molybdopterin adenylyltransferase
VRPRSRRHSARRQLGAAGTYEQALEEVYGTSYDAYKTAHQKKATKEQLDAFDATKSTLHADHLSFNPNPVEPSSACCEVPDLVQLSPQLQVLGSFIAQPHTLVKHAVKDAIRFGVLTLSDRASRGEYADLSGPGVVHALSQQTLFPFAVAQTGLLPDDLEDIASQLLTWSKLGVDVILTTGGTGVGPRDVTPEATLKVLARPIPGVAEAMRRETSQSQPMALLSRALAGVMVGNRTVVINLPGSPAGVQTCMQVIIPLIPRLMELIRSER